jgi:hypothetical protein
MHAVTPSDPRPPRERRCAALNTCAAVLLLTLASGCAASGVDVSPLEVPLMAVAGHGVQVYECRAATGAPPTWTLVGRQTDLFDATGRRIGRHGAADTWRHDDGSGFVGAIRSSVPSPRPLAVPWQLMTARPHALDGAFARVTSVQRLNTVGGQPPGFGCSVTKLHARVRMAYRAAYVLSAPRT